MNDKIQMVTFNKCGTCKFAQKFDTKNSAECFGNPPSVHVIGASQDALGRPVLQLETFVPRVQSDRPACSLHQRKQDFATMGAA